jgi:lysophosphatidylcholine acyltransferase/lyso-PAF acetyltransferase
LGPNYEYTYDKAGIHIINHTTPLETTLSMFLMWPKVGLLGKREALAIPGFKQIVEGLDYILVGRDTKDSKEVRIAKLKEIEDRQIAAEKGEHNPLMMCPEGATTNGRYLIEFKRGAFYSLRPVKPYVSQLWTLTGVEAVHATPISLVSYLNVMFLCGITTITYLEMPDFKPNDFFWKNHWDGKEEKWVAYARAVRTLMAETGGFKLSDCTIEDKLEYKNILRGKKLTVKKGE